MQSNDKNNQIDEKVVNIDNKQEVNLNINSIVNNRDEKVVDNKQETKLNIANSPEEKVTSNTVIVNNNEGVIKKVLYKKNDFKTYELLIFALLIIISSITLTFVVMHEDSPAINNNKNNNKNNVLKSDNELEEVYEVYNLINDSYYKNIDKDKLIDGAINGMLSSLEDPHTSYFNQSETENFNEIMNGSYEGIGAEISTTSNNEIIIFSVFKNSPAYEVGLKHNDIILEVNGKSTKGLTTTEVVALIKDPNYKTAKIKIQRQGEIKEFETPKRIVIIESVESKVIKKNNKKIGYVMVNNFANNTYSQFKTHIEKLEKDGVQGLVIDVRGNTGGYLHSVTSMLDMFLPRGKVIYQIEDNKNVYKYTAKTNESRNYPIAVLTNKSSASASEILAISLKESYGADVVGTYSYGKGTVQTTKDLETGGMIKYTIQKWLSPNGNWINDKGVKPTHEIELGEEYEKNPIEENDNQLQKALNVVSSK